MAVMIWLERNSSFTPQDLAKLQKFHKVEAAVSTLGEILKECDMTMVNRVPKNLQPYTDSYYAGIKEGDWVIDHPLSY